MSKSSARKLSAAVNARAVLLLIYTLIWCHADGRALAAGPLEPSEAIADFQLPPGYRIELVAAEPEVDDPVAIAFDEDGRLWVVEMRDYPTLAPGAKPMSRIRVLEDRDRDGRFESATTFADGLMFPTGLQLWRGGAMVTLAGEVAYFCDTDHDGRSDQKQTWYKGFATGNEQLRANHPLLAANGRVYVAGGLRGGEILDPRRPRLPPVSINGRDFAFDPLTGNHHAVSGNGQFGLTFDDFGRRFTCSNRNPLIQVMIEQRYLERNPKLILPTVVHDVAAAGIDSRLFPRTRAITTSVKHAGQFTAACGVEIYRGDALPAEALGNAFVCEPTANVVHREVIASLEPAMTSKPAEKEAEFLSATDEWFRPVSLLTGPDGALYVIDMYRAVIEHPHWMPEELRSRKDLLYGNDRGRIYRIAADKPADAKSNRMAIPSREPRDLAALLEHPNAWQRETAARLLLESQEKSVGEALRAIVTAGKNPSGRFQALWLSDSLAVLSEETLLTALDDDDPGVREQALIVAESRLPKSSALAEKVLGMVRDPSARVRFQLALTLMTMPPEATVAALEAIALQDAADAWTRRAVALSSRDQAGAILTRLLAQLANSKDSETMRAASRDMIRELVHAVVATGEIQQAADALVHITQLDQAAAADLLLAMADAMEKRGSSFDDVLRPLAKQNRPARTFIEHLFDDAIAVVIERSTEESPRIKAAQILRLDARPQTVEPLLGVLQTTPSPALQVAVMRALGIHRDPRIPEMLLELYCSQLPSVRRETLDLLITRREWAIALLNATDAEQIAISDIDVSRSEKLRKHADAGVRELAERLLAAQSKNREAVVQMYQAALQLEGDVARGKKVFAATCASCHRLAEEGVAVGPDIGDAELKASAQLLSDILDPNRAIDANYIGYTAITLAGRSYQGLIRAETDSGIVLLTPEGKTFTILRDELESLSGGKSLMPDGLEQQVSVEQMADLLAYLKAWRHGDVLKPETSSREAVATPK